MRSLTARAESWPLIEPFVISRLTQTTAELAVVEIAEDGLLGRGESERAEAFDASAPNTLDEIEAARAAIEAGIGREELRAVMAPGAARSAVDSALWDLEAKHAGRPAWELASLDRIRIDRTHAVGSINPVNPVYLHSVEQIHAVDRIAVGDSNQPRSALRSSGFGKSRFHSFITEPPPRGTAQTSQNLNMLSRSVIQCRQKRP